MPASEQDASDCRGANAYPSLDSRFLVWIPILLAALVFSIYSSSLGYDFLHWDDKENIVKNHHLFRLSAEDFLWMFTASIVSDYKPMVWLSYVADRLVWGLNPLGYHLTNNLLHSANAVLAYVLALCLLRRHGSGRWTGGWAVAGAVLTSALFALHPQRVESVMWISERKDVLYGFFYLASLVVYVRWVDDADRRSRGLYLGFTVLGFLSMLSKSMAVTLPVIMLLCDVFVLRRLDPFRPFCWRRAVRLVTEKLPLFLGAVLIGLRAIGDHARTPLNDVGQAQTLWMFPYSLVFYLWKTVWPVELSPLYPAQENAVWSSVPHLLSAALVLLAPVLFLVVCFRGRRWPLFLWLFFVVSILPVLPFRHVADRYTYLPSLGLAGLAVGAWRILVARGLTIPVRRAVAVVLPCVVLLELVALNWSYAAIWGDSYSLWTTAVQRTPSAKAYYGMASAQMDAGQIRMALRTVTKAIERKPTMAVAWNLKGTVFARLNNATNAIQCMRKAIALQPGMADAHQNLGMVLASQGQVDEAIASWSRAIELRPDNFTVHYYLALAYEKKGMLEEALRQLRNAQDIQPSTPGLNETIRTLEYRLAKAGKGVPDSSRP